MSDVAAPGGRGGARRVFSHRDFRLVLSARAVSTIGDWFYVVALIVYVYDQTQSAAWVALAGVARLLPYPVFSSVAGVLADRYDRRRVMLIADGARTVIMLALAVVSAADAPAGVIVVLAFASTAVGTPFEPAQNALVPSLVGEDDLAAANSANSVVENLAILLGPALGGAVLVVGPPTVAFAANAVTFACSFALVAAIRFRAVRETARGEMPESVLRQIGSGISVLRGTPEITALVLLVVGAAFQYGVESVLWVFVADRLGSGPNGVGYLLACLGAGGIIGAALTPLLARQPRSDVVLPAIAVGVGLPLVALAFVTEPWAAFVLVTIEGLGSIAIDVVLLTMLQRLVRDDVRGRVFGLVQSIAVLAIVIGMLLAPPVDALLGLSAALVIFGLVLPIIGLASARVLAAANRRAERRRIELAPIVARLERLALLDGAGEAAVAAVAAGATTVSTAPGQVVVAEDEPADALYVIDRGEFLVSARGEGHGAPVELTRLGGDDYFGEVGVLSGGVRTATVTSAGDGSLLRLDGPAFADAVSLAPAMPRALRDSLRARLSRTHPRLAADLEET